MKHEHLVSVVCPFFNERGLVARAIERLVASLDESGLAWELVLVDDGGTDGGDELARRAIAGRPNIQLISYARNRGRGYALQQGIGAARGEIVITTEIDLTWGGAILRALADALLDNPELDYVVASPHLPAGGFRNVPRWRVLLSRVGNRILSRAFGGRFTMCTGMTRAYRQKTVRGLRFHEHGKVFHVEALLRLTLKGARHAEIPCFLDWKVDSLAPRRQTLSLRRTAALIVSHLRYSLICWWALRRTPK